MADLLERLARGPVICAEGYLFELERRGYLQAGGFVPEVVLEHPEKVAELHRVRPRGLGRRRSVHVLRAPGEAAGHRPRGRPRADQSQGTGDREGDQHGGGALLAGNICNTNVWAGDESRDSVRAMFEEQVGWAAEAGVDFVIGETFSWLGEALLATAVIKEAGLPAVVMLTVHRHGSAREGISPAEACRQLEDAGADVVGLNCGRGPATMLPLLEEVRRAVTVPVAGLPVPYRTTESHPTFRSLEDPGASDPAIAARPFPTALEPFTCSRYEIAEFARRAQDIGVTYLGVCCGAAPHHIRSMAEALGRTPPASRYTADMSKHYALGTDPTLRAENQEYAERM